MFQNLHSCFSDMSLNSLETYSLIHIKKEYTNELDVFHSYAVSICSLCEYRQGLVKI
jgi:hypothetical protein